MTTITKERLQEVIDGDILFTDEQRELARIALASLDADQPVPEEIPKGLAGQIVGLLAHNIGDKLLAQKIWNACRAAMLLANQRDLSQPVDPQVAEYEQIMLQAGWVMVPKTVTPEISLAINKVGQQCTCGNCSQRLWDMLIAAAPQPQNAQQNITENIHAGKSTATPDCWISCSERMPDSKTGVLVAREFGRKGDWRMKWATYIPWHPDTNDGWLIPGASWKPSHWMPLPEPPQQ
ncbi:DUF551 domain-containing protein [Salmonella enterica subsp. enterica serovar Eastbourne]|uniref:DUF551 domain-containing protein n=1 Tax=Salmonella enterica subsp. enterica serovar Eastbourne TaxID=486993 RepID=A0A702B8A4_SALET|nr:DUF551 domain-containing protein [Salmonella enterica subsp. enterica serovar Eastbourne]ECA1894542.1 DUF551 domain-containing protein [Salmonella enterica subsp. enterica serovar Eastbourne]HAC6677870.1 DUF551 domain-containing protein [Salmonella enterica subsp. enterica serovar Eastbourne]HAE5114952.1 DUF551 domain-containing protein [Salmonella enterica subsp. enterica serovar Eastbourne]HAE8029272.1 DUF551 domain-containing protein [Salmonella enterica subsp. enterica serovar Eastbourne